MAEMVIFKRLWERPMLRSWPVLLRKQAYNCGLVDVFGRALFRRVAPRALALPATRTLVAIRDVNLLSALVMKRSRSSYSPSCRLRRSQAAVRGAPSARAYFALGGAFIVILAIVGLIMRRRLVGSIRARPTSSAASTCCASRSCSGAQAAQLSVVLPSASVEVWIVFLAANIALTGIPLIPNRDPGVRGPRSSALLAMVHAYPDRRGSATTKRWR